MFQTTSLILSNQFTVRPTTSPRNSSSLVRRRAVASSSNVILAAASSSGSEKSIPIVSNKCLTAPPITPHFVTCLRLGRPSPELGLISLVFVLSTAAGAIFLLALISIPTKNAFRRLSTSMAILSKVVLEEVPGTLYSLKLSGIEINDLSQQLSTLRQKISGYQNGKKGRSNKRRPNGEKNDPIIN